MTRVLLTGGAGFIGRHLTRFLLRETDWQIIVLDRFGEGSDMNDLARSSQGRLLVYWHDLKAAPGPGLEHRLTYILHLAAASHVDRSVRDPIGFVADNVTGTAHLLEFARRCDGLERFLHFSTDEVFGAAKEGEAFDEYDSFHATNPYAASKAAAEALCPAWANTFGLPICVTRCTNVIGVGQSEEKFIPNTIAKLQSGKVVQIHARAGVSSSRKYIDVEDVCRAVLTVLLRGGIISGRGSGYYNIGGAYEYSNLDDVAMQLADIMGVGICFELVEEPPNRPRPDMRYDVKTERLRALGWQQAIQLRTSLERILAK